METRYLVRAANNPDMIMCRSSSPAGWEFHHESFVGIGGYTAKLYKTRKGAERSANGREVIVESIEIRAIRKR